MNINRLFEIKDDLDDVGSLMVKISHSEVKRITVKDLIAKRNSHGNNFVKEFDVVLRYYLDEDGFQRYVVDGKPID